MMTLNVLYIEKDYILSRIYVHYSVNWCLAVQFIWFCFDDCLLIDVVY